ncbi:hypothetical protein Tco_0752751 [Tanacetum coccineum]|uniref:Uncharacterized protein n=1 Tax=Tanacetum coccineum TaxID=301880 RepID=A0ABQ4Z8R2_9ASTR
MSLASVLVIDGGSRCLWSLRTIAVWDLVEMHLSSPTVQTNMSLLPDSRSVLSSIGGVYQNPAYWIVLLAILDILYYYDMKCFDRSMISECTFKSGEVNVYVFCISDIESLSLKCLQILRTEALLAPKAIKPTARKEMSLKEYEKVLQEKRKALVSLKRSCVFDGSLSLDGGGGCGMCGRGCVRTEERAVSGNGSGQREKMERDRSKVSECVREREMEGNAKDRKWGEWAVGGSDVTQGGERESRSNKKGSASKKLNSARRGRVT